MNSTIRFLLPIGIILVLFSAFAQAEEILRYTDESDKVHFVNSREKIPKQYRDQLKKQKALPQISKMKGREIPASATRPSRTFRRVEVLAADWCPQCKALEKFLSARQISFTRYDIEKSRKGKSLYKKLGGGGIPITRIGSRIIRGNRPKEILKALR